MLEEELKDIEKLQNYLREIRKECKACIRQKNKLSETSYTDVTPRRWQKMNTDYNWTSMSYNKMKTNFARMYSKSSIKESTDEREYNPSGFHSYKH